MKHVKHCLFAAITALLLMVAFGGSAFAETHTITINPGATQTNSAQPAGHTYKAYQIFTCNYDKDTGKVTGVDWLNNDFGQRIVNGLKNQDNQNKFTEATRNKINDTQNGLGVENPDNTAGRVAGIIDSIGDNTSDAKVFAQIVKKAATDANMQAIVFSYENGLYKLQSVQTGYYLIVDEGAQQSKDNDYVSDLILRVVGEDVTLSPKGNVPSVQKKVNTASDATGKWQDAADYNIGDTVPFQLTGTLPSDFDQYTKYNYVFTDTYSAGLTPNLSSIKVYVDRDGDVTNTSDRQQIDSSLYTTVANGTGNTFTVTFNDLKAEVLKSYNISANSKIIVEYNATLNANAVFGTSGDGAGNPNTVKLTYSNNPSSDGTGDTPPDVVYVFTYELDVDKVNKDNQNDKGKNAEFILFSNQKNAYAKVDENHKIIDWVSKENATKLNTGEIGSFIVYGLDVGTYKLTETKEPEGFAKPSQPDTEFTISATLKETLDANNTTASGAITNLQVTSSANLTSMSANKDTGIVNLKIPNSRTGSLPSTGSMGMFIMIGVGICLMAGAGIYLLKNRKKA